MILQRVYSNDHYTYGVLSPHRTPMFVTLELPWRGNQRKRSRIPDGSYDCEAINHKKFGQTIWVKDVPGRDGILFHVGNYAKDTEGCILVGRWYATTKPGMIIDSRNSMEEFRRVLMPDKWRDGWMCKLHVISYDGRV